MPVTTVDEDGGVLGWRIWYTDGECYSSKEWEWDDLPDDGVIQLMLYYNHFAPSGLPLRQSLSGEDWYFKAPGPIYGSNNHPREDTEKRYPGAVLKRGKWTTYAIMEAAREEAMAAREF